MKIIASIQLVGMLLHEFFHAVMAFLMFPFGTRITGIKIIGGHGNNGAVWEGAIITTSKYKLTHILVSAAPILLYWMFYIIFVFKFIYIMPVYCLFTYSCFLSKLDIDNIKGALGFKKIRTVDGDIVAENLNQCLKNRIQYK